MRFPRKLRADLMRSPGTYKAVFEKGEISLGDEPFKFFGWLSCQALNLCLLPFMFIPFIGCTTVNVSPRVSRVLHHHIKA